jgi:hypothetical protein
MTDRELSTEIDIADHEAGPEEMVSVDPLEEGLSDPVHDLEELVESGDLEALDRFISMLHPADLAVPVSPTSWRNSRITSGTILPNTSSPIS